MDAVWYVRYRRAGGREGPLSWEFSLSGGGIVGGGLLWGLMIWSSSYVVLPAAGVYKPIWRYDLTALTKI